MNYLPMQNLVNIVDRMSGVVIVPVIEPRWWSVSRRSCAMKSPDRPICSPSIVCDNESDASLSAW